MCGPSNSSSPWTVQQKETKCSRLQSQENQRFFDLDSIELRNSDGIPTWSTFLYAHLDRFWLFGRKSQPTSELTYDTNELKNKFRQISTLFRKKSFLAYKSSVKKMNCYSQDIFDHLRILYQTFAILKALKFNLLPSKKEDNFQMVSTLFM